MSFQEDLRRNRAVWRRLSGEAGEQAVRPAPPITEYPEPTVIRSESRELSEMEFEANLRRAREEWTEGPQQARLEAEAPEPLEPPRAQARRYSLLEPPERAASAPEQGTAVEVGPGSYPGPTGSGPAAPEGRGELLDLLLRRMEAGARRQPQELGEEAQGW